MYLRNRSECEIFGSLGHFSSSLLGFLSYVYYFLSQNVFSIYKGCFSIGPQFFSAPICLTMA